MPSSSAAGLLVDLLAQPQTSHIHHNVADHITPVTLSLALFGSLVRDYRRPIITTAALIFSSRLVWGLIIINCHTTPQPQAQPTIANRAGHRMIERVPALAPPPLSPFLHRMTDGRRGGTLHFMHVTSPEFLFWQDSVSGQGPQTAAKIVGRQRTM